DRWHSWFRRSAGMGRRVGPRPVVEELEKREVLSGFATSLSAEPDALRFPMAFDFSRFLSTGEDTPSRFLAVDTTVEPPANAQDPLAEGTRFVAPSQEDGFLALLHQDSSPPADIPSTPTPSATNPITIDADWLAARGVGPYVLDQAGATYVL